MTQLIPAEIIEQKILLIRGQKVMLDRDLAGLYSVTTTRLNEAVKRNIRRFPDDFMFQLTKEENTLLISQIATSNRRGGYRKLPFVFTEQGVAMLSSVLKSEQAIQVNIAIMKAFVKLRNITIFQKDFMKKIDELEQKYHRHDSQISMIFEALRQLTAISRKKKYKVGF